MSEANVFLQSTDILCYFISVCIMAAVRNCKPNIFASYIFERKLKMREMKRDGNNQYL